MHLENINAPIAVLACGDQVAGMVQNWAEIDETKENLSIYSNDFKLLK